MTVTYVDAGVLIGAARGTEAVARSAMGILDDPKRQFVSSVITQLEVLPKPTFHRKEEEVAFYRAFFDSCVTIVEPSPGLAQEAMREALMCGLSAMDALHVAAASEAGADELVTTEKSTKPIYRTSSVRILGIF